MHLTYLPSDALTTLPSLHPLSPTFLTTSAIGAGGYGSVLPGQCYDGLPKEMVPGSPCYSQADCSSRYSYSECEWNPLQNMPTTQKMCFCRCGYRYDYTSMSCINRDSCWYCSSGVILAITITILVIVIAVLFFTIPTCALLSCMGGSKQ